MGRLTRWRVGARWYTLALLPGVAMTAATLLLALVSSGFRPANASVLLAGA